MVTSFRCRRGEKTMKAAHRSKMRIRLPFIHFPHSDSGMGTFHGQPHSFVFFFLFATTTNNKRAQDGPTTAVGWFARTRGRQPLREVKKKKMRLNFKPSTPHMAGKLTPWTPRRRSGVWNQKFNESSDLVQELRQRCRPHHTIAW